MSEIETLKDLRNRMSNLKIDKECLLSILAILDELITVFSALSNDD